MDKVILPYQCHPKWISQFVVVAAIVDYRGPIDLVSYWCVVLLNIPCWLYYKYKHNLLPNTNK